MNKNALLIDVKRFSVHDGPGVRTTLFLKGCPLRCRWCHNPESISPCTQLGYFKHKCIDCGECIAVCPAKSHAITEGKHVFRRDFCTACGACEDICLGNALKLYGKIITVSEALELALEDRDFYGEEGGVTISGGEPLLHFEFCAELLEKLKMEGINTAVDTCGCVPWASFEKVRPFADLFLFDFKHFDNDTHLDCTGQGNDKIIDNLKRLSASGSRIEIRIPLVPGCNDSEDNLRNTAELLEKLNIERIRVLPYHKLAKSKYDALDMEYNMSDHESPGPEILNKVIALINKK